MSKREQHCQTCTCGLTSIFWSDRGGFVDLNDPQDIAIWVMDCALDHSYDRTEDGIPEGFPDDLREKLAIVVDKHLSLADPDWRNKTVWLLDNKEAQEAFQQELIQTAKNFVTMKKGDLHET